MKRINRHKMNMAQIERAATLSEECGEVVQAIGKAMRHGYDEGHPNNPYRTNRNDLAKELGQLRAMIDLLIMADDVDEDVVNSAYRDKFNRLNIYFHSTRNAKMAKLLLDKAIEEEKETERMMTEIEVNRVEDTEAEDTSRLTLRELCDLIKRNHGYGRRVTDQEAQRLVTVIEKFLPSESTEANRLVDEIEKS